MSLEHFLSQLCEGRQLHRRIDGTGNLQRGIVHQAYRCTELRYGSDVLQLGSVRCCLRHGDLGVSTDELQLPRLSHIDPYLDTTSQLLHQS